MESKQEILSKYKTDSDHWADQDYTEAGIFKAMDEWSNQQNATLIEQNRKLMSDINLAIVMLENPLTSHKSVIERLQQTLKQTENGK